MIETIGPLLLVLGFVAIFLYSLALQRKAVSTQRTGMKSVAESIELQRRAEATAVESLKLQQKIVELETQILEELRRPNEKR